MLLISNDDVEKVLPMGECISILERGFCDLGAGEALDTGRTDVYTATSRLGLFHRSSILRGTNRRAGIHSVRILSDMVNWTEEGTEEKHCIQPGLFCGLIFLLKTENGEPLAILNDGYLQHLTVGAGAGIGTRYLSRKDSRVLGVLGSGGQAATFTEAVFCVRDIKKVKVFSPTREHRESFARRIGEKYGVACEAVDNPREAFAGSDIVVTATDSVRPVFQDEWVEEGTHLTFVGGDEVDSGVYRKADLICSIYPTSDSRGSDAPLRLAHGFPSWAVATQEELSTIPRSERPPVYPEKTVSIVDVVLGRARGRENSHQITICGGGGGQRFTAVGGAVYELAKKAGLGREIPTEWWIQNIRD